MAKENNFKNELIYHNIMVLNNLKSNHIKNIQTMYIIIGVGRREGGGERGGGCRTSQ